MRFYCKGPFEFESHSRHAALGENRLCLLFSGCSSAKKVRKITIYLPELPANKVNISD